MATLFTAFDRPNYQKLIPQHIVDVLALPHEILSQLTQGGFTLSIRGRRGHNVGIDEGHEMCINKECKEFITRPSADYIQRTAKFLPIRAKAMKHFEIQLFPERKQLVRDSNAILSITATTSECKKLEMNVQSQVTKLKQDSSLNNRENTLSHLFNCKKPTPEQVEDLMNFREIGQKEFECRVQYAILGNPSATLRKRKKRLLTFTERRAKRKKVSEVEKERRLQIECWKKRVAFANTTGASLTNVFQQCIELPRAIATSDGNPVKGTKANSTKVYENRYEHAHPPIMRSSLPSGWIPTSVIMEGMFLINITPWSAHKCIGDYADFLLRQHILCHFRKGATEVHLLFDDPECSPKYFERQRRDQTNKIPEDHYCQEFTHDMVIPPKWRENIINCRKCKRSLVSYDFMHRIRRKLQPHQKFFTAGGFSDNLQNQALFSVHNDSPKIDSRLTCNAEESDTRIWLHVVQSAGQRKLVISADTDVYHIGLPFVAGTNINVIVQLSSIASLELRLLDMQALITAFGNDSDLAGIPTSLLPLAMQVLYVCSGCDFVSFFHGLGKASFLSAFFEDFICSNSNQAPGTLTDASNTLGFFSFLRLVGCTYFRKHKSAFLPSYTSPMMLFNSFSVEGQTALHHHTVWLDFLRERIWSKIKYEEEMIPSTDALKRHRMRSCWIVSVWRQATENHITYPSLEGNGWKHPDPSTLTIDWDSDENMANICSAVALIKKGCGCKMGCISACCKCKKGGNYCGPGCKCVRCCNLPSSTCQDPDTAVIEADEGDESGSDMDDYLEREVDQIMNDIFEEYDCNDGQPATETESDSDSVTSSLRMDDVLYATCCLICPHFYYKYFINFTIEQLTFFSVVISGFGTLESSITAHTALENSYSDIVYTGPSVRYILSALTSWIKTPLQYGLGMRSLNRRILKRAY